MWTSNFFYYREAQCSPYVKNDGTLYEVSPKSTHISYMPFHCGQPCILPTAPGRLVKEVC